MSLVIVAGHVSGRPRARAGWGAGWRSRAPGRSSLADRDRDRRAGEDRGPGRRVLAHHAEVVAYLSVTVVTAPSTRSAACRTWPARALVSPVRSGTVINVTAWTAKLALIPAATWVAPVSPVTCAGPVTGVVVPLPSSPFVLSPQASTVPSDFSATM